MTSPGQLVWHVDFEAKRLAGRVVQLSLGRCGASGSGAGEINGNQVYFLHHAQSDVPARIWWLHCGF